jgi:hypothetical protein
MVLIGVRSTSEGLAVTNDMLGIVGVFLCAGVLLLIRHLLVMVGKGKSKTALTSSVPISKSSLRLVDLRSESRSDKPQVRTARNP